MEKTLLIDIAVEKGATFPCPCCQEVCPVYDTVPRNWQHLNFWQHQTVIAAKVPRVQCSKGGTKTIPVPWAREGSGFTLLFEALVLTLVKDMPVLAISEMVGVSDTRLWRVIRHYTDRAHAKADWSKVGKLGFDEVATKKGHTYATVVVDVDPPEDTAARLLFMTEGKTADCVGTFAQEMKAHNAFPEQVDLIAIDMGKAYQAGARKYFQFAKICFDRFHVMQLAGKAVDQVRMALKHEGVNLGKEALWALRGNEENLRESQKQLRAQLCEEHATLGRAMALREFLRKLWACANKADAAQHLKTFCSWAQRSRLPSFVKLASTIKEHAAGILGFFPDGTTSAAIECINGIIQLAKRRARGFRNFANLRAIAYLMAGRLDLMPINH